MSASATAGIVVAVLAFVTLLGSTVVFVVWRNRNRIRRRRLPELSGDSKRADYEKMTGSVTYNYFFRHKGMELDVRSDYGFQQAGPIPMVELSESEIHRAELYSPAPDWSRSPTLVDQSSMITPEYEHTHQPWTTRLEMPSPSRNSGETITAADLAHDAQHSPQHQVPPEPTSWSPCSGSSTSAVQSPVTGYKRSNSSPPASPSFSTHVYKPSCFLTDPELQPSRFEPPSTGASAFISTDLVLETMLPSGSGAKDAMTMSPTNAYKQEVRSSAFGNRTWGNELKASFQEHQIARLGPRFPLFTYIPTISCEVETIRRD